MFNWNRRSFLKGCCMATAAAAGTGTRLGFGAPGNNDKIIVYLFLRGGIDGLSLIPPVTGANRTFYETHRPDIQIPLGGSGAALPLNGQFGIHGSAGALKALYDAGHMAVIQAVGILPRSIASRSHFEAQNYLEYGTPGATGIGTGWLARHLASAPDIPANAVVTAIAAAAQTPVSLLGAQNAMTVSSAGNFVPNNHFKWREPHLAYLDLMYQGNGSLASAVQGALNAVDVIAGLNLDGTPGGGAIYPNGSLGDGLEFIAKVIKQNVGLRVATVDYGGWDTHNNQGSNGGGYFASQVATLSEAIYAFFTDVEASGLGENLTLVVHSEFGRRVRQNDDDGTDHGSGNVMLIVDGTIYGGQIYGLFPGLSDAQLFQNTDVAVTTDFRTVLSEIITVKQGNPNIDLVFPGFSGYSPIGLYPPPPLFKSDFES